jgi:hypothetical protein
VVGGLLLLPGSKAPANLRRWILLAPLLAASYLPLSTALETIARPSVHTFSLIRPAGVAKTVEKTVPVVGLRVASRRDLNLVAGRRRDIQLDHVGFVTAPRSGTYELSYACDDECSIGIGADSLERLTGIGSIRLKLDEGTYPLTIRYRQLTGPSSFVLSWNRPGVLELLPMDRFVGDWREAVDPSEIRAKHRWAVLVLALGSVWLFLSLASLVVLGEHLWSVERNARALVGATMVVFLVAVMVWTPDVSRLWLGAALLVLIASWFRVATTIESPPRRSALAVVVIAGLLFTVLANYHVGTLNGPWYWKWNWRRLDPVELFATMGVAFVPFLFAQLVWHRRRRRPLAIPLGLMMVTMIGFQIGARIIKTAVFRKGIVSLITNTNSTSYFRDAASFTSTREWLSSIPELMHDFHLHSRDKPPGNVVYFVVFRQLFDDPEDAAYASGVALGLLASLSIPFTYWSARALAQNEEVAFASASLIALAPGLSFFSPMADQLSPVLGCLLVGTWALALRSGSRRFSIAYGLALSLVLFVNYTPLVLGVFLGGYTVLHVLQSPRARLRPAAVAVLTSLATVVVAYSLLWVTTGYDPLRTFVTAVRLQYDMLDRIVRPYPETVWYDPVDFALGVGWVNLALAATFIVAAIQRRNPPEERKAPGPSRLALAGLVIVQLAVVAVSGLIPGETARVWNFMFPLLTLAAAFELSRWRPAPAMLAYSIQFLILVTLYQNMAMGQ